MGLSKEGRVLLYTRMYTAVSKATAEARNANGESVKSTYNGTRTDLFSGICNNVVTIRAFMWAITHKTDALPTVLFKIVDHGVNGIELSRLNSGFYDECRNHIVGTSLVPFIMEAMKLWKPTPKVKKESVAIPVAPVKEFVFDLSSKSDEELTALSFNIQKILDERAAKRAAQAKLQTVLELAEMSKEELMNLLEIV